MSYQKICVIILVLAVIAGVVVLLLKTKKTNNYVDLNYTNANPGDYFFPGNGYYQYFPPSTKLERQYYTCVIENNCTSCPYDDDAKVRCLERCRIKTFKAGIPDRTDLICTNLSPVQKYNCMNQVYSDYRYGS